jgi:hypothetical protein
MSRGNEKQKSDTTPASKKPPIRLRFGAIPVVDAQGMERLRRAARKPSNRLTPEMPEWHKGG